MSFNKKIILGDGILGSELHKKTSWDLVSRNKNNFDVFKDDKVFDLLSEYTTIINCIAFTNTYSHDRESNWKINYEFVDKLVDYTNKNNKKLVHISTDYIYSGSKPISSELDVPVHLPTWYGYTKLLGDAHIQLKSNDYLILRLSHKEYPFKYEKAWVDMFTNCDYTNIISDIVIKLIENDAKGIYNVGTETKTMYQLAIKTKSVTPINKPEYVPENTTMSLTKLNNFLNSIKYG